MKDGIAFSDRQVEQLTELLASQHESTVSELKAYVDEKFAAQDTRIDEKFADERHHADQKFSDLRQELMAVKQQLVGLETRLESDTKSALEEIAQLKRRLTILEKKFA